MRSSSLALAVLPAARAACTPSDTNTTTPVDTTPSACIVTEYAAIAAAVANCTNIVLQDIYAPANSSINLTALLEGTTVTFAGNTVNHPVKVWA